MMRFVLKLVVLLILAGPAVAATATQTVTSTLTIVINAPLAISFSPANPTINCNAAAGTVVSAISQSGGDANPVTVSISGDTTDFALSATTLPANVIVGTNGIAAADCGKTNTVTITATQN